MKRPLAATNAPDQALASPPLLEKASKFRNAERIHHVRGGVSGLSCNAYAEFDVPKTLNGVRVRIYGSLHTVAAREAPPAPVEIQSARVRVDLDDDAKAAIAGKITPQLERFGYPLDA